MFGDEKVDNVPPHGRELIAVGAHDHPVCAGQTAARRRQGPAIHLDHAEPATARRLQFRMVAEARYVNAVGQGRLHDRCARRKLYGSTIDGNLAHGAILGFGSRG